MPRPEFTQDDAAMFRYTSRGLAVAFGCMCSVAFGWWGVLVAFVVSFLIVIVSGLLVEVFK